MKMFLRGGEKMTKTTKPLDLEELADELIRKEYPTYDSPNTPLPTRNNIIRLKERIRLELEQHIKSACEFYREWWNNPKILIMWFEDKRRVNELIKFLEQCFGETWQEQYDYLEDKRVQIILKYNEWLFKLAFKSVFKGDEK